MMCMLHFCPQPALQNTRSLLGEPIKTPHEKAERTCDWEETSSAGHPAILLPSLPVLL